MKVTKIDLITIGIPLKKILTTSFGSITDRQTILIRCLSEDGLIGYGESSLLPVPLSEPEIITSGLKLLRESILPLILNKEISSIEELKNILDLFPDNPVTKIGVEGAFYHLFSQQQKTYIGNLFGSKQSAVVAGETISISSDTAEIDREINKFISKGYHSIKVKIKPGIDLQIIKYISKNFPAISFGVDANAAYSIKDIGLFQEIDSYRPLFIEQPFADEAIEDHAKLQQIIQSNVCLDESVKSFATAKKAIEIGACKAINIKPARIGSYLESIQIHDYCLKHGINLFVGGRLESGIGKAVNLALAGLPGFNLPLDLSPTLEYFTDDIVNPPFDVSNGLARLPFEAIGLGGEIDEAKIDRYTLNKISIE